MTMIRKALKKVFVFVVCMAVLTSNTLSAFAAVSLEENVVVTKEDFMLNGEHYSLETMVYSDKIVATVYNSNNQVESSFTNNMLSGEINGIYLDNTDALDDMELVQSYSTPNYKLVSTTTGTLKPVAWTTVAIIAAIAALNPGAGTAAIAALASAIVTDAGASYKYKLLTYTASDSTYFYQKNVFKIYNKETGKKVGPDLVTKIKTRQK